MATNSEVSPRSLRLLDSSMNLLVSVPIPASTSDKTRFSGSFVLPAGINDLRLQIEQTTDPETVMIYSARVLVAQQKRNQDLSLLPTDGKFSEPNK